MCPCCSPTISLLPPPTSLPFASVAASAGPAFGHDCFRLWRAQDGQFLISACHDNLPMLRDGEKGDWIGTFESHSGAVWSAKLNANATRAATGSADSSAKFWNSVTGELLATFVHKKPVRTVDFRPDSASLATGGYEGAVRLFDLARLDAAPAMVAVPGGRVKKLVWAPDGRTLFVGSEDGGLRVMDVASQAIVREKRGLCAGDPEKNGVMDIELSRDGSTLTMAVGQSVTFVNANSLEVTKTFDLRRGVETASLHPTHARTFLAGGFDVYVRVYDLDTGAELAEKRGHHGKVHCLRFAPDGNTYASGADDATIRLWRYDVPSRPTAGAGAASSKADASLTKTADAGGVPDAFGRAGSGGSSAAANSAGARLVQGHQVQASPQHALQLQQPQPHPHQHSHQQHQQLQSALMQPPPQQQWAVQLQGVPGAHPSQAQLQQVQAFQLQQAQQAFYQQQYALQQSQQAQQAQAFAPAFRAPAPAPLVGIPGAGMGMPQMQAQGALWSGQQLGLGLGVGSAQPHYR